MSKLSRSVLKEIVKECIVEVFEESFFPSNISNSQMNEQLNLSKRKRIQNKRRPKRTMEKSSHLDSISYGSQSESKGMVKNENFDRRVDSLTSNMTSDPVMSSIFKDTANTTLQEQANAESGSGKISSASGDAASRKAFNSDPTELFSEASQKWAALAFSDTLK